MKRFSEFENNLTTEEIVNEAVNTKVASVARLLFRKIRQLHLETLANPTAGVVEKDLSEQLMAVAGLMFLVLAQDDPTLVALARSAQ